MVNRKHFYDGMLLLLFLVCGIAGCGKDDHKDTAIAAESAADSQIDFPALKEENSDIFAWLYIPDTQIDHPVLQNSQTDDFYSDHNVFGEEDSHGAVYIELANVANMCDFNTVLHGSAPKSQDSRGSETYPFTDLYRFANPDFFDTHENIYLYLDGNILTYEVFAAYERKNTSLIREYDFTDTIGCLLFLNDLYSTRYLSMNLRDGWSFITPYHFLITLTAHKEDDPNRQFVVVAVLVSDDAGTISRVMEEY